MGSQPVNIQWFVHFGGFVCLFVSWENLGGNVEESLRLWWLLMESEDFERKFESMVGK